MKGTFLTMATGANSYATTAQSSGSKAMLEEPLGKFPHECHENGDRKAPFYSLFSQSSAKRPAGIEEGAPLILAFNDQILRANVPKRRARDDVAMMAG